LIFEPSRGLPRRDRSLIRAANEYAKRKSLTLRKFAGGVASGIGLTIRMVSAAPHGNSPKVAEPKQWVQVSLMKRLLRGCNVVNSILELTIDHGARGGAAETLS
jgi:hypothetical protein